MYIYIIKQRKMATTKNYSDTFSYKESLWEGNRTSYVWQTSKSGWKIVRETRSFYLVVGILKGDGLKKFKKTNIDLIRTPEQIRNDEIKSENASR